MEKILCPKCGEPIASVARAKEIIDFCKQFWGQCSCGQKYQLRVSLRNDLVLFLPDRQVEIVC